MNSSQLLKEQRDYVWAYFELHANQRMNSFNFFVVIAALLTTGLAGTLHKEFQYHSVGIFLSLSLTFIAFIFWKLDQRVRFLIKHAEEALREIEKQYLNETSVTREDQGTLFAVELQKTENLFLKKGLWPWKWHLSYSDCFGLVFLVFGALGLFAAMVTTTRSIF